jgi:hypothetical protein
MVDGLHLQIQNRTMKSLSIALSGIRRGWRGEGGGKSTNAKAIQNCHTESPPHIQQIYPNKSGENSYGSEQKEL